MKCIVTEVIKTPTRFGDTFDCIISANGMSTKKHFIRGVKLSTLKVGDTVDTYIESPLTRLTRRLRKVDIELSCVGNVPFIYLDKINDKKVVETNMQHGHTIYMLEANSLYKRKDVFKLIRRYLCK